MNSEFNKKKLSKEHDERVKNFNCLKTFPYGTSYEKIYQKNRN